MIVVSDTSVISALIQIGRAELLSEIFGAVVIPQAVADELMVCHINLPVWIQVREVRNRNAVHKWTESLDLGESEAIVLALEQTADVLLIDERAGRAAAQSVGLEVVGLLGIICEAKRAGLVSNVSDIIQDLRVRASFRISLSLEIKVLSDAGEI